MFQPPAFVYIVTVICFVMAQPHIPTVIVEDANFWRNLGKAQLKASLGVKPNNGVAKNVILFIGDGMGISTITAGRIYKGQKAGHPGEEEYLSFEKFPITGLIKTYTVNRQVPDSAGTATALLSGVKTNQAVLGVDARVTHNVCDSTLIKQASLESVATWAQVKGKDTGLVTTTRVTHATPAALYAHSPNRNWESDSKIPISQQNMACKDIAYQLVQNEPGRNLKVIFGGGEKQFRDRSDRRDLVEEWKQLKTNKGFKYKYVTNKEQLDRMDVEDTDCVLGLFSGGHMAYEIDRNTNFTSQPSLTDMTLTAIRMLQKSKNGFFLLVEGGRIDHAHHENRARKALEEVVAFDEAVKSSIKITNPEDTLIIVTGDHSHSFTINGYPSRGNNILKFAGTYPDGGTLPYTTLSYANGPGFYYHRDNTSALGWRNLSSENTLDPNFQMIATFPQGYETHGGEDMAVYATGPMAHLLQGVHEQNFIAWVMSYAACIGPAEGNCVKPRRSISSDGNNSVGRLQLNSLMYHMAYMWLIYKYFLVM